MASSAERRASWGSDVSATTVYTPSANVVWNEQADELVLFDSASETYHALDPGGSAIWRRLGEGRSVADLAALLAEDFAGDPGAIENDVAAFLAEAEELGLVSAR